MKQPLRILSSFVLTLGIVLGAGIAALPVQPAAAAEPCTRMEFSRRQNSNHWCVEYIQTMLNLVNQSGLVPDGEYGPKTAAAVKAWQAKLKKTDAGMMVDGIVGPQTWDRLCLQNNKYPSDFAGKVGCGARHKVAPARKAADCDTLTISRTRYTNRTDCIFYLQQMLNLTVDAKLKLDSIYGPKVTAAVKTAQAAIKKKSNSSLVANGITGPRTWQGLCTWQVNELHKPAYNELREGVGC